MHTGILNYILWLSEFHLDTCCIVILDYFHFVIKTLEYEPHEKTPKAHTYKPVGYIS